MTAEQILVTGAAGFTGQYLIAAAKAMGYRCIALCRHPGEAVADADENIPCDLLDAPALRDVIRSTNPKKVVHLAAISFVPHGDVAEIYNVNLVGTINLLNAIAREAPDTVKVLLASSANIYGNPSELPIGECAAINPVNHYGISKYAMEMAAGLYRDLPLVITRPFNYSGVGQPAHFLLPKLVAAYRDGRRSVALGNIDIARDFSDVRDVVNACLGLVGKSSSKGVYNICSGRPTGLLEIIDLLNELAGYEISIDVDPEFVRSEEISVLYGDATRIESALGDYRQYTLRDTLSWMLGGQ